MKWISKLRFSIRVLLIGFTVVCALLAYYANRVRRQQQSVAAIQNSGPSRVYYAFQLDRLHNGEESERSNLPTWLIESTGNDFYFEIGRIDIGSNIQEIDVVHFRNLPHVRAVVVITEEDTITAADVQKVAEFSRLESLCLNAKFEEDALEPLRPCRKLRRLHLESHQLSPALLAPLRDLPSLKSLVLVDKALDPKFTAESIAELRAAMPGCKISCR